MAIWFGRARTDVPCQQQKRSDSWDFQMGTRRVYHPRTSMSKITTVFAEEQLAMAFTFQLS
eukprot:1988354-Karenia_brevis.AAC.1